MIYHNLSQRSDVLCQEICATTYKRYFDDAHNLVPSSMSRILQKEMKIHDTDKETLELFGRGHVKVSLRTVGGKVNSTITFVA